MDFSLTKQQQMAQKMFREFAENEVKPLAKQVDAEEMFPVETVRKMAKLGMMGIYFPKEYGGAGGRISAGAIGITTGNGLIFTISYSDNDEKIAADKLDAYIKAASEDRALRLAEPLEERAVEDHGQALCEGEGA